MQKSDLIGVKQLQTACELRIKTEIDARGEGIFRGTPHFVWSTHEKSRGHACVLLTAFAKQPLTRLIRSLRSRIAGVPARNAVQAGERPEKNETMETAE